MIKNIISRFTMKIVMFSFTDIVSGKPVYRAVDKYGQVFLVESKSPFTFRVKLEE